MIFNDNCIDGMKQLDSDSVDLIVTDPPYGMSFMGKNWDKALPDPEAFEQMLRVLKPGAFAFVMCAPRSDLQARMSILLEDAGFDIAFTPIYWTFATGFPKAQTISKQLAKKDIEEPKYNGAYVGFQPKPAVEVVIVAMKPRTEKTYVDQCLSNGHGITWLDDCRIPSGAEQGRFPANLLVSDDSLNDGIEHKSGGGIKVGKRKIQNTPFTSSKNFDNVNFKPDSGSYSRYFDLDAWFAIIPKPAKSEKIKGVESNTHPTVKPIKLMSYLITLGSRPDEIVLDPFMGSGTTGISAKLTGRNFIGFELEEEYFQIAEARINAWETGTIGQNKEDGRKDKEDGKSQSDGTRVGQTTLTSN